MATQYVEHVTIAGERWDLIAWNYYGDPTNFSPIVMANPAVPITPVFGAGIAVQVPLLEVSATPPNEDLPPWKRSA